MPGCSAPIASPAKSTPATPSRNPKILISPSRYPAPIVRNRARTGYWTKACRKGSMAWWSRCPQRGLLQTLLESGKLVLQPLRQPVTETVEVLADRREFGLPGLDIYMQQSGDVFGGQVEAAEVEVGGMRHEADRRLRRARASFAAVEDPLQDPAVIAEARPQETTMLVLPKPIHVINAR